MPGGGCLQHMAHHENTVTEMRHLASIPAGLLDASLEADAPGMVKLVLCALVWGITCRDNTSVKP